MSFRVNDGVYEINDGVQKATAKKIKIKTHIKPNKDSIQINRKNNNKAPKQFTSIKNLF